MHPVADYRMAKERQNDILRWVEDHRVVGEEAIAPSPLSRRARVWMGVRLIRLGERLAERREAAVQPPITASIRTYVRSSITGS